MEKYVIIGSGIIGSAIAREIRKRDFGKVVVLEKEPGLGYHASGRNSGVIHSGINQTPGLLKAMMCLNGNKMLRDYCREKDVPMEECGTLVIGRNSDEIGILDKLMYMGKELGVPGLKIINQSELRKREPFANGLVALLSPTGAIVDSKTLLRTVATEAESLGARYQFNSEVREISDKGKIKTNKETIDADFIINCAGLHADKIAHMVGVGLDYKIIPFKGNYLKVPVPINSMLYQPPDLRFPFLGVHLTRKIDGSVVAGPTATLSLGKENYEGEIEWGELRDYFSSANFMRMALYKDFWENVVKNAGFSIFRGRILEEIQGLTNFNLKKEDLKPAFCGIRAQMVHKNGKMLNDVLVEETENSLHVLNAVSPGLTCSLAFAEYVVNGLAKRT